MQQTVKIRFNAGIYNTINSPEAHFAFPDDDVTRFEDFYGSSDSCCIPSQLSHRRTKNEIFLFPRDFTRLSAYVIFPCPSPLCWYQLLRKSTSKYFFFQLPTAPRTWRIYQNWTYYRRKLPSTYLIYKTCRFESYRSYNYVRSKIMNLVTRPKLFQLGNKIASSNNQIVCCYWTFSQTLLWNDNKQSENILQQGHKKRWK